MRWLFALASLLTIAGTAAAHGGSYRGGHYPGPGDTVPPNSGGPSTPSSPTTPSAPAPATPTAPAPTTPTAPGPTTPSGPGTVTPVMGRRGPATGGSAIPEFDLTEWSYWWEFNKEPFLNLKRAIHAADDLTGQVGLLGGLRGAGRREQQTLKPSLEQLRDQVTPALKRALEEAPQRDIVSSCLIALAKIDRTGGLQEIFRKYLTRKDQEISETAVLAFGIAQDEKALADLAEIFKDTARGQELVGDAQRVNFRKQAFAGYALGLIAYAHRDLRVKREVFAAAQEVMAKAGRFANRDVPVAAIQAIRLLNLDPADPEAAGLAAAAGRFLLECLQDEGNRFQIRAQIPTAVARLLGRESGQAAPSADDLAGRPAAALKREAVRLFAKILQEGKDHDMVQQSCVLALGQMGHPGDRKVVKVLQDVAAGDLTKDLQARFFAWIALGDLGGPELRADLVSALVKPGRNREKPWIALALGIESAQLARQGAAPDPAVGEALLKAFEKATNPSWKAGLAVALGLARFRDAGPALLDTLEASRDPGLRGYCAVGLGLMGHHPAVPAMTELLGRSLRLPELVTQVSIGLGLMGEKGVVKSLLAALKGGSGTAAGVSAVATGLGFVGDTRAIGPLVEMLFDRELAALSRAFAAVALGIVGDKEDHPWNAKIGYGLNYRASVETLVGSATGILDLL